MRASAGIAWAAASLMAFAGLVSCADQDPDRDPSLGDAAGAQEGRPGDAQDPPSNLASESAGPCVGKAEWDPCNTDDNVCTIEHCDSSGTCVWDDVVDVCAAQSAYACQTYACDPVHGCVATGFNEGVSCDDYDDCTTGDVCVLIGGTNGFCAGAPLDIDDGSECTADSCVDGQAVHTPLDGTPCQSNGACEGPGTCEAGTCVSDTAQECDDGLSCTADSCKEDGPGCRHDVVSDHCLIDGECWEAGDSKPGVECAVCVPDADPHGWFLDAFPCKDGSDCTINACDEDLGCQTTILDDSTACWDGSECTVGDHCEAGACVAEPVSCEDGNPCTLEFCFPTAGCVYFDNPGPCDDGNPCTVGDICIGDSCASGETQICDDFNECTVDSCAPTGGCDFTPVPDGSMCDDGCKCTMDEACVAGACEKGSVIDCTDGDPCTMDYCEEETGECEHAPLGPEGCDDGNLCTLDSCDPASGCAHQALSNVPCEDGDQCTAGDTCLAGLCHPGGPADCNDGSVCTADSCNPATGCKNDPLAGPCEDGDTCTTGDQCVDGACLPGAPLPCDDNQPCTDDFCTAAKGCKNVEVFKPCDDGDACTTDDMCLGGQCQGTQPVSCDDQQPCTSDSCHPDEGCEYDPVAGPCDDGDACTAGDECQGGVCESGAPVDCDDQNPCTDDSCDAAQACSNTPNQAPCSDGNLCTVTQCQAGSCAILDLVDCDDANQCTKDSCDPAIGCANDDLADGSVCDDGDACTNTCELVEKYQVLDPHPNFPAFAFDGFGPVAAGLVFFRPSASVFFEVDGAGGARLFGPLIHVSGLPAALAQKSWSLDCRFTKRAGPGSGGPFVQEAFQSAFSNQWEYFDLVAGQCSMQTADGTDRLIFTEKPAPGVFPFQIGPAASSLTTDFGYSNWVNYIYVQNGQSFAQDGNGEPFNTDFHGRLLSIDPCEAGDQCVAGSCVGGAPVPGCAP